MTERDPLASEQNTPVIPRTCIRCKCAMLAYPSVPDGFRGLWFRKCVFCTMAWDNSAKLFDGWVDLK